MGCEMKGICILAALGALLLATSRAPAAAPAQASSRAAGAQPGVELKRPTAAALLPHRRPDPKAAKPLQEELTKARTALTLADYAGTVAALERALQRAREQAPMELSRLTVVDEIPEGLGMYRPAPGAVVPGGFLRLYGEVRNFVPRQIDGGYEVQLVTDAYFYYEDGEFIAGSQGIGEHRFSATTRHDVTFMVVELHTTGLPPQPYYVELVVTDKVSGKQARAHTRFVVQGVQ